MSEVVTGEAVVVSVRVAALPSRALALLLDLLVQGALLLAATLLLAGATSVVDNALGAALYIVVVVLVVVGYPVVLETATRGRSLGKMALGLRVVGDDGSPERFRQALFRGLAGTLEFWATSGVVALIASLISARGKRLGDVFAGTVVIGERAPRETPPPPMPPGLDGWARALELSRLPDQLANAARQYLTRSAQLTPEVQRAMGERLAMQVAGFVTPPPPPGVPPYPYLAAVLAERRRRAELRLGGHAGDLAPTGSGPRPSPPGQPPPASAPPAARTSPEPPRLPGPGRRGGFTPPT